MKSEERKKLRYLRRQKKRKKKVQPTISTTFTLRSLYKSYKLCIKNVGWKASVQKAKITAFSDIVQLKDQVLKGSWKSKGFYCFDRIERGKVRHIKSVHIKERIVQRCLCDFGIIPILSKHLIYDNGATVKNKGIHFAHRRLVAHLRKTKNQAYFVRYDIHDYFGSLPHAQLFILVNKMIADGKLWKLLKQLINDFGPIGLGLGSQVAQICAITFMTKFDQYSQVVLQLKKYARYMDDGYALCDTKEKAKEFLKALQSFCLEQKISLNRKKCIISKVSKGIVWLKSYYYKTDTGKIIRRPCKASVTHERQKIKKLIKKGFSEKVIRDSYNSWKSWLKPCKAYYIIKRMDKFLEEQLCLLK